MQNLPLSRLYFRILVVVVCVTLIELNKTVSNECRLDMYEITDDIWVLKIWYSHLLVYSVCNLCYYSCSSLRNVDYLITVANCTRYM